VNTHLVVLHHEALQVRGFQVVLCGSGAVGLYPFVKSEARIALVGNATPHAAQLLVPCLVDSKAVVLRNALFRELLDDDFRCNQLRCGWHDVVGA